jgi:SAM-dependent methyltransferase
MTSETLPIATRSRPIDPHRTWRALVHKASAAYRDTDRYALHFARGKLGGDPVFRHVLERGLIAPGSRVLDLGCGQGLLASLLRAAAAATAAGEWPPAWGQAPLQVHVTGMELMQKDADRARQALGADATIIRGDMRETPFPPADTVVFFDALHYISRDEQDDVLARARAALQAGGTLLLRAGDLSSRPRFLLGIWIDRITMWLRGGGLLPLTGRSVHDWSTALRSLGFEVKSYPMSGRKPFANVLLIGRLPTPTSP